jgi:hypothetical protein
MAREEDEWEARIEQAIKESDERAQRERPVDEALYWTEATILQCERVIAHRDWARERHSDWTRHDTGRLEALSLLNAAGKALRWIKDAEVDPDWDKERVKPFADLLAQARPIRNKREHDDEYGPGKQAEPLKNATAEGSNLKLMVGPNVTVHRGEQILLGGIVDVHALRDAALATADEFRRVQHGHAPADHFRKQPGMIGPDLPE